MRLYSYYRSSSAWRVRIALAFKGIRYEYVAVHLVKDGGEQHRPDFRAKNMLGQVPVLEVESAGRTFHVSQSLAIIDYLESTHPNPALYPQAAELRARALQLAEVVNSGIQPLQNTEVLDMVDREAPAFGRERWAQYYIKKGLVALERLSADVRGRYLVGDSVSVADVCLIPQLFNARRFNVPLDECPGLLAVESACQELEAFRVSHPSVQPDTPADAPK
jgi:maleylpyruvate isomerase